RWIADYAIKRPRACLLYHAEHVVVRDLIFQKSGFWNLQITYSNDVLVEKVIIRNNDGPSTDGIDIDSSTNVRVYECDLACGDDCIAIKSGRDGNGARVNRKSSRIEVARCKIRSGYGVTIGSEVSAGVSDVYI
ncbi:glycoside hydrolase family 28 protein, partial [Pseudomonas aeruginosa]|nr:glycoside hydrolase family 28 protein [Pseudomonas aeruginosa]